MEGLIKFLSMLIVGTLFFSFIVQNKEDAYSLTITVKDLRNSKGVVQYAIYNKDGSIPDEKYEKYYKRNTAAISNSTSTITFYDLPRGRYAVSILHDENENGRIDKRFIMPKEGIGFSNFESIRFTNRPTFSKAYFELNSNITKSIKIIYM